MSQLSTPISVAATSDYKFSLTLASLTVAPAKISRHVDGGMLITAPARVFKLGALSTLAECVAVAIAHSNHIDPNLLVVEAGLHIADDKLCRAIASVATEVDVNPEVARLAVTTLFENLKGISQAQSPMDSRGGSTQLDSKVLTAIKTVARDRLAAVGGSAISYPCSALANGVKFAELSGQFGPKPSSTVDQVINLEGLVCNGFERDVRCVTFILQDDTKLRAYWANDREYLHVKKLALEDDRSHALTFKVTADQSGRPVHTVLFDNVPGMSKLT